MTERTVMILKTKQNTLKSKKRRNVKQSFRFMVHIFKKFSHEFD